ncbi:MAG: hypothetical protein HXS54_06320 [Theionarchaea archaeon]|nr:hypothetical protein [Theionarchaea archaeon]DBA34874.1 TPA_asm: hypothetical protein vir521_00080 [Caudoviricetes sp. vir521]
MALEEVCREVEKHDDGEERYLCMICGDVYFVSMNEIIMHLNTEHALIWVIYNIVDRKGYRNV